MLPVVYADITLSDGSTSIMLDVNYDRLRDGSKTLDLDAKTLTFKNTNIVDENVTFEVISNSGYTASLNSDKVNTFTTLIGAAGKDVILNLKVPTNIDEGVISSVAKLRVKSATVDKTFDINTKVLSMLEVKEIVVFVNGNEEKVVKDETGSIKKLKPGDKIKLQLVVENQFDTDYDYGDIEGTFSVSLDDSDFGEDVDEETDFSIDAGDKMDSSTEGVVEFTIPTEAEDGEYTLDVKVESEDENKAQYETKLKIELKVERTKDDIRVESVTVTPIEVSCAPRNIQIVTKVTNEGSNSQKHVVLQVESVSLGLKKKEDFALERGSSTNGNSYTSQIVMEVSPDLKVGTYKIDASTFFDYTVPADKKTATLVVKSCAAMKKEDVKETTPVVKETTNTTPVQQSEGKVAVGAEKKDSALVGTVSTATENTNGLKAGTIVETREREPYTAEDYLMGIIIVVVVFVISLIILCLVLLFR